MNESLKRRRERNWRHLHKLCHDCGNRHAEDRVRCLKCLESERLRVRRYRLKKRMEGQSYETRNVNRAVNTGRMRQWDE